MACEWHGTRRPQGRERPLLDVRLREGGIMWTMPSGASRLDRITVDPEINHGKPSIRGMRIPVQTLFELLASGMTFDEVLDDYPALEREDVLAALEFAAVSAGNQQAVPFGP
jgi:uncharacterized protein (DUF433 family)